MKRANIVSEAAGLLAVALALTGCNSSNEQGATPGSNTLNSTTKVQSAVSNDGPEELRQKAYAQFEDAKLYSLGIILYAQKNANFCPTNLDQTLPYLRAEGHLPSGTNNFEVLYHGSLDKLPNPMTNDIILIRGDAWQEQDGKWMRVYGFADGHCETRSQPDGDFGPWEKQHLAIP